MAAPIIPLGAHDPLMQPIPWNGREYRTSHFLHRDYRANSLHGGKFREHRNFIRKMKELETYQMYIDTGDLVVLHSYKDAMSRCSKTEHFNENKVLREAFAATGWQAIYLVSPTIQIALSHHMDDQESKRLSVAANTKTARELMGQPQLPSAQAKQILADYLEMGKMLGSPVHITRETAVKRVLLDTGVDLQPMLTAAPSMDAIPPQEQMLEPNDLAERLGLGTGNTAGHKLNVLLAQLEWQEHRNGGWVQLPAGKPYSSTHAWMRYGKTGYNMKWNLQAVSAELKRRNLLPPGAVAD
jgi:hypothetical protein